MEAMNDIPAVSGDWQRAGTTTGNLEAQIHETHTGVVVLLGEFAYKAKKPVVTDFLDFSTPALREEACRREVELNRRLSPASYLGVAHFAGPHGGPPEPVVMMRRYHDSTRLASLVTAGHPVEDRLDAIADALATFHRNAARGAIIDEQGSPAAIAARWEENLEELRRCPEVPADTLSEVRRLAEQFMAGRTDLFGDRVSAGCIVDGHADLLADDIFCLPDEVAMLDCLEFDDTLRHVDVVDDAAFLAMDLEFLGQPDLGTYFLAQYRRHVHDTAPRSLVDFYVAYRAVVRAKVDCIRVRQGHAEAATAARRHLDIALKHLRAGTIQLIIVGGGPGTGKTTISTALAEQLAAVVISTDDVRRELQASGALEGRAGTLNAGLYSPQNVAAVYDEVLRRAHGALARGRSVILDGTWRDSRQRERAHAVAARTASPIVEFTCSLPLVSASARIESRSGSTSDATPEIAAALAGQVSTAAHGHEIDTSKPLHDSVAEAHRICCLAI